MSAAADVNDAQWESTVLESDVPVLVDFWAEWCAPCKAMGPYVDKLARELGSRLRVVKLNIEDNREISARYSIESIPTFLLLKSGEVVARIVGTQQYAALKAAVEPHL